LEVTAESPDLLLHHSLRELLYLLEDEALAPVSVEVVRADDGTAALHVGIDREIAETLMGAQIKAVTRHGLQIMSQGKLLQVTLVFDV
jgi:SHS2 domain-containing protein